MLITLFTTISGKPLDGFLLLAVPGAIACPAALARTPGITDALLACHHRGRRLRLLDSRRGLARPLRRQWALTGEPLRQAWLWAAVLVAGGLRELNSLLHQPHLTTGSCAHPTISALTDPAARQLSRALSHTRRVAPYRQVPGGPMSTRYLTIIGYLNALAAGVILQVQAVRMPEQLPTLGQAVIHVLRTRTGRVGILSPGRGSGCTSSPGRPDGPRQPLCAPARCGAVANLMAHWPPLPELTSAPTPTCHSRTPWRASAAMSAGNRGAGGFRPRRPADGTGLRIFSRRICVAKVAEIIPADHLSPVRFAPTASAVTELKGRQ